MDSHSVVLYTYATAAVVYASQYMDKHLPRPPDIHLIPRSHPPPSPALTPAGFSSAQPGASCLGSNELPGGVDTNLAEAVMDELCKADGGMSAILDYCGGHAKPFHYHERISCLYSADPTTQHSTRIGTAIDGNGICRCFIKWPAFDIQARATSSFFT